MVEKKVGVLGLRGFPHVMGGVEKHCEQLYPRLAKMGYKIVVCRRKNYISRSAKEKEYKKVQFIDLWSPRNKHFEAFFHSLISVIILRIKGVRIIHAHSFGPGIVIPLAKLLRMNTVLTYHLPNYHQGKWNSFDRIILKTFEFIACKFSDKIICVSETNRNIVKKCSGKDSVYIRNGVNLPTDTYHDISKFKVIHKKYVLAACRLVPEKGLHILIEAFSKLKTDWNLVIVGGADHKSHYVHDLHDKAKKNNQIIFTGVLTGMDLGCIFQNAGLFVLPSSIEGQPISLLEAMSFGLPFIVSDIPAHRELCLNERCYFRPNNIEILYMKLREVLNDDTFLKSGNKNIQLIKEKYNWDSIAKKTGEVYKTLINN